jgi:16S rRNA (adenine1518-N6/adenine1519-N6)-dimethyltransferase
VLEVGAGPGTLTRVLAPKARAVEVIELDRQFRPVLDEVVAEHGNVHLCWGDARKVDLPAFDVVIASLPYSTSLPILFRLLEHGFERGAVLLQERQARRLAARPGERGYSRVGVMAQRLATIEVIAQVPRDRFLPEPAVDSSLVRVAPDGDASVDPAGNEELRCLLDTLFLRRRDRLEAALRAAGLTEALAAIDSRLRRTAVERVTPAEFDLVHGAVRRSGLRVPRVPARVKRRST